MHRKITEVDTPMPETADGSGYTTEPNIVTEYSVDNKTIKIRKVGDMGWSVWLYESVENGRNISQRGGSLDAQEAQRVGYIEAAKLSAQS